jgi:hypothetical protein
MGEMNFWLRKQNILEIIINANGVDCPASHREKGPLPFAGIMIP